MRAGLGRHQNAVVHLGQAQTQQVEHVILVHDLGRFRSLFRDHVGPAPDITGHQGQQRPGPDRLRVTARRALRVSVVFHVTERPTNILGRQSRATSTRRWHSRHRRRNWGRC